MSNGKTATIEEIFDPLEIKNKYLRRGDLGKIAEAAGVPYHNVHRFFTGEFDNPEGVDEIIRATLPIIKARKELVREVEEVMNS